MRIHYHLSGYISHRRAGLAYMECLRALGHTLTDNPSTCQVVIVHESPTDYADIFSKFSLPSSAYRIGYAVWETPQLPARFQEGLRHVDAVWTCSEFSRLSFAPFIPTFCLPHVVARHRPSLAAVQRMARRCGVAPGHRGHGPDKPFLFYTIVDSVNPRKDLKTLLTAFATAFPVDEHPHVRLVVKQYRLALDLSGFPQVIDIPDPLSDDEMAALHALGDVYVSAHHAEAWGLPLSEALSFGKPVLATGYSGNMEFMTPENSFPLPYHLAPVSAAMCRALPNLFTPQMTWADIDVPGLIHNLRQIRHHPPDAAFRARAAASMERFSPQAIARRLEALLPAD